MRDLLPVVSLMVLVTTTSAAEILRTHAIRSSRDEIDRLLVIARRIFRVGLFVAALLFGYWLGTMP